ncbi:hypothetical protein SAMN05421770_10840 [Granulicella rosea]|uniref:Streptogramin lyase n=1 Tax=Granulicella rosea TaxID=474952 RepID=A0A239LYS9_9BACT|nr:hypothetical protein [Granulicella rosea]SNT34953.1 hypothetical protein SAMN05421770_10840 [Granulicella rosea]
MTLRRPIQLATLATALILTGCATFQAPTESTAVIAGASFSGAMHGGQQPISGATIQLYAVGAGGYGAAATPLLTTPVTTDANGAFNISGDYSCSGVNQVYLTGSGGNPGLSAGTTNSAIVMMAALGSCSNLVANAATTFINMNEVTTVAGAWSLARFMTGPANAGTSAGNATGLANAFAAANKVVNLATGQAPGTALPAGATLPIAEIDTLANILASCVNTNGTSGACSQLFAAATPSGGAAPTDTLTAALNIAHNPGANVATLFNLSTANPPFGPTLTSAPTNWLIGIHYTGGGLSAPTAMAVDATGNIWLTNANNSVSEFAPTGAALSSSTGYTAGPLSGPSAIAIDTTGNAWVANATGNSLTRIAPLGASATNFTGGGLNQPAGIAIDASGNLWVPNKGGNSVSAFNNAGAPITTTPYTGAGISQPAGVAINVQ